MEDDRVRQFLEIESKTSELLAELEELHTETIKYSTANQALDSAASQIGSLSASMISIAGELQTATISLKDIGMPALLAAQDESKAELQNLHRQAEELKNNEIRGLLAAQDESKAELQNLHRQAEELKNNGVHYLILTGETRPDPSWLSAYSVQRPD